MNGSCAIGERFKWVLPSGEIMTILAHRGNRNGSRPNGENTLSAVKYCVNQGWGLEVDVRQAKEGDFYLSHDVSTVTQENKAVEIFDLVRRYPNAMVAVNVKELGYEDRLVDFLSEQLSLRQFFLFDMELIESVPGVTLNKFKAIKNDVQVAVRVSDHDEPIERALSFQEADIVWLDEFETLWVQRRDIQRLHDQGKKIYAVSPELHQFPLPVAQKRWQDFLDWGVEGICTDYPQQLSQVLIGAS